MSDPTHITTLQRTLVDCRQERRRIVNHIADLEQELEQFYRQRDQYDRMIETNEQAIRLALCLPEDQPRSMESSASRQYHSPQRRPSSPAFRTSDIDQAIEEAERSDRGSNVRFADFRIPQAATIVLREADRPLHVSEIFRRMEDGGFEFRGQHQMITLAVSLSRSKRFRKVAPGTFELEPAFKTGQVA